MKDETVKLNGNVKVACDVQNRIQTTGVKGLDIQKAKELGVFNRISLLLCAMHSSIAAAYRIYGGVDYLSQMLNAKRNDIARAMNDFERAYDKFMMFWTDFYSDGVNSQKEMNEDVETLFINIMKWAQLPLKWEVGEEQRIESGDDAVTKIGYNDSKVMKFYSSVENEEVLELEESWCVTKFDMATFCQDYVEKDLDKGTAVMIAKRMSDNDKENLYTASVIRDTTKKEKTVTPMKIFRNNEAIGNVTKLV